MPDRPPSGSADHAQDFARRYAAPLDEYCAVRMEELGIHCDKIGAKDYGRRWRAFEPDEHSGGTITTGIVVDSGVLNPELLKGKKGGRIWPCARLKDRIDAIIAHEFEEDRLGSHIAALKAAPKTELPVTSGARRILRAMGR